MINYPISASRAICPRQEVRQIAQLCPYRCQHNTALRYLTAQLQQVSNVGYRQCISGNLPTTGSLTAVKLARQCFDNETAAMINYPISASRAICPRQEVGQVA